MFRFLRKLVSLLVVLGAVSCGHSGSEDFTPRPDLRQVYSLYLTLNASHQDANGFLPELKCDSLLFSALNAIGRGQEISLRAAEISPGHWYRNPDHVGCDDDTSRDMILGVIAYSLYFKRLDILNDLWDYGVAHNWKMGEGDLRTVLSPGLIGVLAKVIAFLGGEKHAERFIPNVLSAQTGSDGHLTLLNLWILDRVEGELGPINRSVLASLWEKAPANAFASFLYSKYNRANQDGTVALLLRYPNDRLPNGSDWCEQWRLRRVGTEANQGTCPAEGEWSGGDFLFVSRLVLEGQ